MTEFFFTLREKLFYLFLAFISSLISFLFSEGTIYVGFTEDKNIN